MAEYRTTTTTLHALAVIALDCGFLAYKPILQSRVYRLGLLGVMKGQIDLSLTAQIRPEATEDAMQDFRRILEDTCDDLTLNATIREVRIELANIRRGLECLANLPSLAQFDEESLKLFDKHSGIM